MSNINAENKNTKEDQVIINKINQMEHVEMCSLWRSVPSGHPYFDTILSYSKIFKERLFKHFDGFMPEISKEIGW